MGGLKDDANRTGTAALRLVRSQLSCGNTNADIGLLATHGISEAEIKELIKKPEPIEPVEALSNDEKFQYLYMVIQMMKVDRQIFKSEIEFCKNLAEKLGFRKGVVAELSSKIYSDPTITADRDALKKSAFRYLK